MKKNRKKIIIVSILLILVILFFPYKQVRCYRGTEFKDSFSFSKFNKIEVGMSETEVTKTLGEPYGKLLWEEIYGSDSLGKKFDYGLMYYKPIDWENHLIKRINIKEHKVVEMISEYNCED